MDVDTSVRMVGGMSEHRHKADFYPTPSDCTVALMQFLELSKWTKIWEPACGDGAISKVLAEMGYPVISTDIEDHGFGQQRCNFLKADIPAGFIITNPPFSLAEQFIRHSYDLNIPFAFLLKAQFWNAAKRKELFRECTPHFILPLTWRPDFTGGGASLMDMNWNVWYGKRPARYTDYIPLDRPSSSGKAGKV